MDTANALGSPDRSSGDPCAEVWYRRTAEDSGRLGVDLPKALLFDPIHCT